MAAETTIIQRFGIVINWLGVAVALICLLGFFSVVAGFMGAFGGIANPQDAYFVAGASLICAGLSWLAGRAIRYILAGF
jgi:multisubunit Na+/H+ antiporter MnhG subunit